MLAPNLSICPPDHAWCEMFQKIVFGWMQVALLELDFMWCIISSGWLTVAVTERYEDDRYKIDVDNIQNQTYITKF